METSVLGATLSAYQDYLDIEMEKEVDSFIKSCFLYVKKDGQIPLTNWQRELLPNNENVCGGVSPGTNDVLFKKSNTFPYNIDAPSFESSKTLHADHTTCTSSKNVVKNKRKTIEIVDPKTGEKLQLQ